MSRVLVTGVTGFIGAHVAKHLIKEGNDVFGVARTLPAMAYNPLYLLDTIEGLHLTGMDLCDYNRFQDYIQSQKIEAIYHFASQSVVSQGLIGPYNTFRNNTLATLSVLEACRIHKIPSLIFTSDKVYGPDHSVVSEDSPYSVGSTYESSKVIQDVMALSYEKTFDMQSMVVRSCNVYGPADLEMSRVIPDTIVSCIEGKKPLLEESKGRMIRTYIYIDDLVSALHHVFCKYLECMKDGSCSFLSPVNVGSHNVISTGELKRKICDLFSTEPELVPDSGSMKEIGSQIVQWHKLENSGWSPQISLDEGLDNTSHWWVEWWEKYKR